MIIKILTFKFFRNKIIKRWSTIDNIETANFNDNSYIVNSLEELNALIDGVDDKFLYKNYFYLSNEIPYHFSKINYYKNHAWHSLILDTVAFICNDKGETTDKVPQKHPSLYYNEKIMSNLTPNKHIIDQVSIEKINTSTSTGICIICGRKFFMPSYLSKSNVVTVKQKIFIKKENFIKTIVFKYSRIVKYDEELFKQGKPCLELVYDSCF